MNNAGSTLSMLKKLGTAAQVKSDRLATESCMSPAWRGYTGQGWRPIRAVRLRWRKAPLRRFPHFTSTELPLLKPYWWHPQMVNLLDFEPYKRPDVHRRIEADLGWRGSGRERQKSKFTRYFQIRNLHEKLGYDKRRSHLPSLIASGQTARSAAMSELASPQCPAKARTELVANVAKKLGMDEAEMAELLRSPGRSHGELLSGELVFRTLRLRRVLGLEYRRWRQGWEGRG